MSKDTKAGPAPSESLPSGEDDDDDLRNISLPSGMVLFERDEKSNKALPPQKPSKDEHVDDAAISDCWNLLLASHDEPLSMPNWRPKSVDCSANDILGKWRPEPLALPTWAIDPAEMTFVMEEKLSTGKSDPTDIISTAK